MKMMTSVLFALLLVGPCLQPLAAKDDPCKDCKCAEVPWPPKCNGCCLKFSGTVVRANKENSSLTIRTREGERTVVYDSSTMWTMHGAKGDANQVNEGNNVTVLLHRDEKGHLVAERIDVRGGTR